MPGLQQIRYPDLHDVELAGHAAGDVMRLTMAVQGITDSDARSMLWTPITPEPGAADRSHAPTPTMSAPLPTGT